MNKLPKQVQVAELPAVSFTPKCRQGGRITGNDSAPSPQLLSLLLEALTCPDQGVQLSTLSCLEPVIASPPPVLLQQLEAVVGRLLALVCSPAMVSRRLQRLLGRRFGFHVKSTFRVQTLHENPRRWLGARDITQKPPRFSGLS